MPLILLAAHLLQRLFWTDLQGTCPRRVSSCQGWRFAVVLAGLISAMSCPHLQVQRRGSRLPSADLTF